MLLTERCAARAVAVLGALAGIVNGLASTDTITWGGDNSRTGYQTNHNMDPAVVGSSSFVQLFKTALPGNYGGVAEQIFSQPLVYTPTGSSTQYVYFATTQNNIYKLDAKTGVIVASKNLAIPFLTADLNGCVDVNPHVGVTSTGVIDPDTDTLYLTTKTYANQTAVNVAQGKPAGRYYLHALSVNDLTERPNFPVNLEGTVARNNPTRSFNGGIHHQRPALLHSGQFIYAGFASHCVQYNFTGWIMGWDKSTGATVENYAMEGAGVPNTIAGGGIWMSGGGLASDDAGSIFFATGNGYASQLSTIPVNGRTPPTALEEAAVHMTINTNGSLSLVDFFMPQEKQQMDGGDRDLGTSPLEILPSQFSCGNYKRIGVVTAKTGKTYWLNLDDLGGYRTGPNSGDRIIQVYQNENSVYAGAGVYPLEGGYIYINVIQHPTHVFQFSCTNGVPAFTKVADTPTNNGYILGVGHGTTTSLNGQPGTGLLWTSDVQNQNLRIYNAIPNGGNMTMINSFVVPGTTKFTRPVFGDGTAYMGTTQGYVYGFGSSTTRPLNCTTPINFGNASINAAALNVTVTCTAKVAVSVTGLTINSNNFAVSSPQAGTRMLVTGTTYTFTASFQPSSIGLLNAVVYVNTGNVAGYSAQTPVSLSGTGVSAQALLSLQPGSLVFDNLVTGSGGEDLPVIIQNQGQSALSVSSVLFSNNSTGPFTAGTQSGSGSVQWGDFTFNSLPSTIAANSQASMDVFFDGAVTGNFTAYMQILSNGGNKTLSVTASAGPPAKALLEFQTPDQTGWVTYVSGQNLTFGNVTEGTTLNLQFRVSNVGGPGAVNLDLTVSKPPFGVPGIIGAANQVDLAEGTVLSPGQSAVATLYCTVPKVQWNTDPYSGNAQWTMNTNDPTFDKQFIQFWCNAVAEQAAPLGSNGLGLYRYVGCYKENNPGRQLSNQLYSSQQNTIAMCIAACANGKYAYCGTQYNSECWAGNTIPSLQVDGSNCNFPCTGNLSQICGGNGYANSGSYISLFDSPAIISGLPIPSVTTTATTAAATGTTIGTTTGTTTGTATGTATTTAAAPPTGGPYVNPGVNGFTSIGCYTEATTGRALTTRVNADNTVAGCIKMCATGGYSYAGVEYGGECWCGNSINTAGGSAPTAQTDCNMVCNGNATEYCGAGQRLSMYQGSGTTTPVVSSGPQHVRNLTSGGTYWTWQGCVTEATTGRALSLKSTSVNTMTVENCAAFCAGYTYFGTEYGQECYCGNSLNAGAVNASTTDCNMLCAANSNEYCGAGSRLDLYMAGVMPLSAVSTLTTATSTSSTATSSGTSTSVVTTSATSTSTTSSSTSTTTTSATSTSSTTTASSTSTSTTAASSTSTTGTTGTSSSGTSTTTSSSSSTSSITSATGAGTLTTSSTISTSSTSTATLTSTSSSSSSSSSNTSTSTSTSSVPTTSSSTSTVSSTTTTTSSSTSSTSSSSTSTSTSAASTTSTSSTSSTSSIVSSTTSTSSSSSSSTSSVPTVASVTSTTTTTPATTTSTTSSTSTKPSTTSTTSSSTSISTLATLSTLTTSRTTTLITSTSSTTTSSVSPTATGPPTAYPGNSLFKYIGCWSEPTSGRLVPYEVDNSVTNQTIEHCLSLCTQYQYAGVEYGHECWCGNTLNMAAGAGQVAESQCSTKCPGNPNELCGAGVRLNLYQQTASKSRRLF